MSVPQVKRRLSLEFDLEETLISKKKPSEPSKEFKETKNTNSPEKNFQRLLKKYDESQLHYSLGEVQNSFIERAWQNLQSFVKNHTEFTDLIPKKKGGFQGGSPYFAKDIREELLQMEEKMRKDSSQRGKEQTNRLKEIIKSYDWPGFSNIGLKGTAAMCFLVQCQEDDLPFQKKCLLALEKAVARKEALFEHYAALLDKIKKEENLPQIYGTQVCKKEGVWALYKVEDPKNLDVLRNSKGLPPISKYLEELNKA